VDGDEDEACCHHTLYGTALRTVLRTLPRISRGADDSAGLQRTDLYFFGSRSGWKASPRSSSLFAAHCSHRGTAGQLGLWAFWVRGAERGGEGGEGPNHRHQTLFDPGHFLFDRIALQQRGFSQMAVERSNRPGPRCLRSDAIPLPVLPAIIMGPWDDGLDGLLMMLLL
jgi:hypothetical protein